jgi:prepilin-type N-terminal cleavage/methylation domain-containing protein
MVNVRPGFSLTEVIVAMTLLSIAALGVAATALVAVQSFTRAEMQQIVLREADAILDSLLMLPQNSSGSKPVHTSLLIWNAADSAGAITLMIRTPHRGTLQLTGQR